MAYNCICAPQQWAIGEKQFMESYIDPANNLSSSSQGHFSIRIKELSERDRRHLLIHFLSLDDEARMMRFGIACNDDVVTRYVQKINFSQDAVFGVFNDALNLVGVGHLAYTPRGAMPALADVTECARIAEFGVSVLAPYRSLGIGTRLLERAAMHCRNDDIDTLCINCLASNDAMVHIAARVGMTIHCNRGEVEALLKLPPANPVSILREALDEQVASIDLTVRTRTRALGRFLKILPGIKSA